MSIKDIKEGIKAKKVLFGIRETVKFFKKKTKGKKEDAKVFVVRDARDSTKEILKNAGIEFTLLKSKDEVTKELDLNFESEVFLIK